VGGVSEGGGGPKKGKKANSEKKDKYEGGKQKGRMMSVFEKDTKERIVNG